METEKSGSWMLDKALRQTGYPRIVTDDLARERLLKPLFDRFYDMLPEALKSPKND